MPTRKSVHSTKITLGMANYSLSSCDHHLLSKQCYESIMLCYQAIAMLAIRQSLSPNLR